MRGRVRRRRPGRIARRRCRRCRRPARPAAASPAPASSGSARTSIPTSSSAPRRGRGAPTSSSRSARRRSSTPPPACSTTPSATARSRRRSIPARPTSRGVVDLPIAAPAEDALAMLDARIRWGDVAAPSRGPATERRMRDLDPDRRSGLRQIRGSVTSCCRRYLPFLSAYEISHGSSLWKNSTCAMPSLA